MPQIKKMWINNNPESGETFVIPNEFNDGLEVNSGKSLVPVMVGAK